MMVHRLTNFGMQGEALSKTYEAVEKDMTLAADLSAHPSANMRKCEDRLADPGRAEYDTSCYFPSPSTLHPFVLCAELQTRAT
jgi:hypothetical protein